MMSRVVSIEVLDGLEPDNRDAIQSRKDLQRVHRAMGTRTILLRALKAMAPQHATGMPFRVLEIGAGDGSLMLGVAQSLRPHWSNVRLTLFDRQALITLTTIARYAEVGWTVTQQKGDVLDLAAGGFGLHGNVGDAPWDLIVANLFLHHFEGVHLDAILGFVSRRSVRFFACEPRRGWLALAGSHLIGALGVNRVTRADSVLSVHAGFDGQELSDRWPDNCAQWKVQEYAAGFFSHCLSAERAGLN
jgi:hypothetical protein